MTVAEWERAAQDYYGAWYRFSRYFGYDVEFSLQPGRLTPEEEFAYAHGLTNDRRVPRFRRIPRPGDLP